MLCKTASAVMRCLSVPPSVCLSVTFVDSVETKKNIFFNFFNRRVATLFCFSTPTSWHYSDGNSRSDGVECKGYEKITIFDQYLAYLANDARQSHSYYGRRIENHTQTFEWYSLNHIQRPVTHISRSQLFNAK